MSGSTHGVRSSTSAPGEATCVGCGCTDLRACAGGCSWLAVNRIDRTGVCSNCARSLAAWRNQQADDFHDALPLGLEAWCDQVDLLDGR